MRKNLCFNRWSGSARIAAVTLSLGAMLHALAAEEKGIGFNLDKVSPGTDLPQVEISLGMRPYANDLIFVAGIKQGFYKDVGLTITPLPYGRKVLADQAIPLLVNKQIDMMALYPPDVIATMDSVKNIRFIALTDLFQGFAVLARPGSNVKTVGQFMAEGLAFEEAMKRTMAQLKGKSFVTAPVVDNRIFLETVFSLGGMNMNKDTKLVVTADSNALQLESAGRIDFASPTGAPFTAQLRGAGWIPLVSPLRRADQHAGWSGLANSSFGWHARGRLRRRMGAPASGSRASLYLGDVPNHRAGAEKPRPDAELNAGLREFLRWNEPRHIGAQTYNRYFEPSVELRVSKELLRQSEFGLVLSDCF